MKPDIVEFAESTLGHELTEFQKKLLRTYYEHKDDETKETLYTAIDKDILEGFNTTSSFFDEYYESMIKAITETTDKKIFEKRKESGDIKEDFALILNPKHKDIIPELWYKAGLAIPVIWSPFAEEEKCYVVTDKTFVKNARVNMHSIFGLPGWLPKYEGVWVADEKEKEDE